jgi:hypothetical protein
LKKEMAEWIQTMNACVHQPEQKKTAASPNKSNPQIKSSVAMKTNKATTKARSIGEF